MPAESHPRHDLHPTLLSPVRLSIVAALAEVSRADFRSLAQIIEVSDSLLSKNLTVLENEQLIRIEKGRLDRRPRTWISLTKLGATAFRTHLAALEGLVALRLPDAD